MTEQKQDDIYEVQPEQITKELVKEMFEGGVFFNKTIMQDIKKNHTHQPHWDRSVPDPGEIKIKDSEKNICDIFINILKELMKEKRINYCLQRTNNVQLYYSDSEIREFLHEQVLEKYVVDIIIDYHGSFELIDDHNFKNECKLFEILIHRSYYTYILLNNIPREEHEQEYCRYCGLNYFDVVLYAHIKKYLNEEIRGKSLEESNEDNKKVGFLENLKNLCLKIIK